MAAPVKPPDVIDREAEWRQLGRLVDSPRPELIFVLGRRRVGKSYVLARFAREVRGIYYQATRRTENEQLAAITQVLGDHFADPALSSGIAFPTWEALFGYLRKRASAGDSRRPADPLLIVLDEFPYLVDAAPALPSILQQAWDHTWQQTPIKIVLSGSYVTAMRRLEDSDQPLFGRRTARLSFAPFTVRDVGAFVPTYDARDRLRTYGVFGHLPGNLALLDPALSFADNAAARLLDPSSRLVDDAQHLLDSMLPDAGVHLSILAAIANGEQTWQGITSRVGRSGGAMQRPLRWLEEMGLVNRVVPITEKNPSASKRARYRIADPYLSFWFRHIAPLLRVGTIGLADPQTLWRDALAPRIDDHMGPVFEDVCRDFVATGRATPFQPVRVGEWWDGASNDQVDVVALSGDGQLLVGECKWGRVTAGDLRRLRERAIRIAALVPQHGAGERTLLALFAGRGSADADVLKAVSADDVQLHTPDTMLMAW